MLLFWYLVKDMIFPFFLGSGIISSILLMDQIFQFIPFLQASGLEIRSVVEMILYSLMPILLIATPISLMIGVYAGINRFSSDYELVVMRASGVSISFIYKPVIFLSSIIALIVMVIAFYLSPISVGKLEKLKFNILKKHTKIQLTENRINDFFDKKLIYIFNKKDDLLNGVFIADKNNPEKNAIIEADHGKIYFDETQQKILFRLNNGRIHYFLEDGGYRIIDYKQLDYDLIPPQTDRSNLPARFRKKNLSKEQKRDVEWTITELAGEIKKMKPKDPTLYEYIDEFHSRIVTVLSCICFSVFALPMGIVDPRRPKAGNIIYMIGVLIIYFLLYAQARSMLLQGRIPAFALYIPLILAVYLGLYNYYKVNNDVQSVLRYLVGLLRSRLRLNRR